MTKQREMPGRVAARMVLMLGCGLMYAGAAAPCLGQGGTTAPSQAQTAPAMGNTGVLVDQVIAVVNGDLVLESDVDEERRFEAFQPLRASGPFSRQDAIGRLIDRTLILQQAKLQPDDIPTDAEVQTQLTALRKNIPACREYHCETDAGWAKYVQAQGFSMTELTERWRQRMEILRFIEQRFRMGIRVEPQEIRDYYDKTLVPEYRKQNAKAPALDTISDRIQEILLQERVTSLLEDWLKSLKAQGSVRLMRPDEVHS